MERPFKLYITVLDVLGVGLERLGSQTRTVSRALQQLANGHVGGSLLSVCMPYIYYVIQIYVYISDVAFDLARLSNWHPFKDLRPRISFVCRVDEVILVEPFICNAVWRGTECSACVVTKASLWTGGGREGGEEWKQKKHL